MYMEAVHKKPRKAGVRSTAYDINYQTRAISRRNLDMKRWIQDFYENDRNIARR